MKHVIIAEDEKYTRMGIQDILYKEYGNAIEITECRNGAEALSALESRQADIVVTDIRMPKLDGLGLMQEIKKRKLHARIIVLSGYEDFNYAVEAVRCGAVEYLLKPVRKQQLIKIFNEIFEDMKNQGEQNIQKEDFIRKATSEQAKQPEEVSYDAPEITMAARFINGNYGKDLNLAVVANLAGLNYNYFSGLFKKQTGMPFHDYLKRVRMEKARELLKNRRLRIAEIGRMTGYCNEKHFMKDFKAYTGVTPTQYRDKNSEAWR